MFITSFWSPKFYLSERCKATEKQATITVLDEVAVTAVCLYDWKMD